MSLLFSPLAASRSRFALAGARSTGRTGSPMRPSRGSWFAMATALLQSTTIFQLSSAALPSPWSVRNLNNILPPSIHLTFFDHPNQSLETTLVQIDGTKIPVELIQRPIDFCGRPHRAVAVRDLRARKEAENHIRFLAHYDGLTGLPNRTSFKKKCLSSARPQPARKSPRAGRNVIT